MAALTTKHRRGADGGADGAGGAEGGGEVPPHAHPPSLMQQASGKLAGILRKPKGESADSAAADAAAADAAARVDADADLEACDVLVCSLPFVERQAVSFVRFKAAVRLHPGGAAAASPPPRRFLFVVFGPAEAERENLAAGRAFAVLMGDVDFAARAQVLQSKDELLEVRLLPQLQPLAHNPLNRTP